MIRKNYSINITENNGCFNVPHRFILSCNVEPYIIKAIHLRGFKHYPFNGCEIVVDNKIKIIVGLKEIKNLDETLAKATDILDQLLDISVFELNVAKELIKNEIH